MVTPLGNLIFKKFNVVPGRLETVACGVLSPPLPPRPAPRFFPSLSSKRLMNDDFPTFAAPITYTLFPWSAAVRIRFPMSFSIPTPDWQLTKCTLFRLSTPSSSSSPRRDQPRSTMSWRFSSSKSRGLRSPHSS
jgi:hypothetical protein